MKRTSIKIDGKNYPALNLRLTEEVGRAMRVVRKHFRILTAYSNLPEGTSRYDGWWDFAAISVRLMLRLDAYLDYNASLSIGSGYISEKPWINFGGYESQSEYRLNHLFELIDLYDEQLSGQYKSFYDIPYTSDLQSIIRLSLKYELSVESMVGVCLLFTRDLLYQCGPDCEMFFDLFTNDGRDNPENLDLDLWETNRIRLWGRFGALRSRNSYYSQREYESYEHYFYQPRKLKLKKCQPVFELLSINQLFKGISPIKVEI